MSAEPLSENPNPIHDLAVDGVLSTNSVRLLRQKALFGGKVTRTDVVALCNEVLAARATKSAASCRFPKCPAPPITETEMCQLHRKVSIAGTGSDVDDKHKDGGHG